MRQTSILKPYHVILVSSLLLLILTTAGWGGELTYVSGALRYNILHKVDKGLGGKLNFPFVDNKMFLFLEVDGSNSQLFAYYIKDIMSNTGSWVKEPKYTYKAESLSKSVFRKKRAHIFAFFPGPALLEHRENKWRILSVPDTKNVLINDNPQIISDFMKNEGDKIWMTSKVLHIPNKKQ